MDRAQWFFRAIESAEGWVCRHGNVSYDKHPTLDEAIEHLRQIASESRPSQVFVHYLNGDVRAVAAFD